MVDRQRYPYVVALVEENNSFSVRYIKGVHKKIFIEKYKNKQNLKENGFCFLSFKTQEIVYLPKEEHFMILETNLLLIMEMVFLVFVIYMLIR